MKLRGVVVVEDGVPSRISQAWIRVPALEPVANRPILEHVLDALQLAGVEEVLVVTPAGLAGGICERLKPRDDVAIRYLEQDAPIDLAADSEASKLLQRVRDEAHRFAIEHHRGRRDRAMTGSVLDELKGVGAARKRALLQHFGSPERLLAASREELEAVPGVPGKIARDIHEQLNRTG